MNPHELEAYTRQLYQIGRWHARQLKLSAEDVEDCTMEFVGRMLRLQELDYQEEKFRSTAWLNRCARHHASNWLRAVRRHQQHYLQSLPEGSGQGGEDNLPAPTLEELLLCRVFWEQFLATLQLLAKIPGSLFVGYYLKGYSTQELAQALRMTPHAVEQSLLRSRRRLRHLLEKQGWNEATTDEHLTLLGYHWLDLLIAEETSS